MGLYSHKTISYPPLTSSWIHSQSYLNFICIFSHFNGEENGKLDKNGTVGYAFPMIMRPHVAPSILNLLNHQVNENCYTRNSPRTQRMQVCNNRYTSLITAAPTAPRETSEKKSFYICIMLFAFYYKMAPVWHQLFFFCSLFFISLSNCNFFLPRSI